MKKRYRWVVFFSMIIISLPVIILMMVHFTPKPPAADMEKARNAISEAAAVNASKYSERLYKEASALYDSGMVDWQRQNKKFIYLRNYDKVIKYARMSADKAAEASTNSSANSSDLKMKISRKLASLKSLVKKIDTLFNTYPLDYEIRTNISRGKVMLRESEIIFDSGDYFKAYRKLTDSEYLLNSSYKHAYADLENYFRSYDTWRKWINKTLSDSRRTNDYSIIIDKFSRKCLIYLGGNKKYEFNAELGSNWVGEKRIKGDKATPEGMYRITEKFEGGKTKYYKALLINYPNDDDRKRFRSEIKNGTLPSSSSIGGLIEIHGEGGKGVDWTEGCIALADDEMDVVYRIAKKGTPVTIVGSMIDLESVMNR
jgi:hypothetical protein